MGGIWLDWYFWARCQVGSRYAGPGVCWIPGNLLQEERIEVIPQLKPPVTRDFGVGGSRTPPGGASDLAQTLPPGDAPHPRLLLLVSLCNGETEVLRR